MSGRRGRGCDGRPDDRLARAARDSLFGRTGVVPGRGQGLVEYGLILGLSALLAVLILVVFGDQVADLVQWVADLVEGEAG